MDTDLLQKIGIAIGAIVSGIGMYIGMKRGDGKPPPERPIQPAEMIAKLEKMKQDVMDSLDDLDERHKDRQIELIRAFDRLEAAVRLDTALKRIERNFSNSNPDDRN